MISGGIAPGTNRAATVDVRRLGIRPARANRTAPAPILGAASVPPLRGGDNVVDRYLDLETLFPGGNMVSVAVAARRADAAAAYLGVSA